MERRVFIVTIGGSLLATRFASDAQETQEVRILFRPAPGMRLSYKRVMTISALDPSGKPRVGGMGSTLVIDVIGVGEDDSRVRMALDGTEVPATFPISKDGLLREASFDRSDPMSEKESYAFGEAVGRWVMLSTIYQGPWKSDETRPVTISLPPRLAPLFPARVAAATRGNVTFRRIQTLRGLPAAEFDFTTEAIDLPNGGMTMNLVLKGQHWVDMKTGVLLRTTGTGTATTVSDGRTLTMQVGSNEVLDLDDSRGFPPAL